MTRYPVGQTTTLAACSSSATKCVTPISDDLSGMGRTAAGAFSG